MSFYNDRKVLVTGGTGMIGRFVVKDLLERGAKVRIASLDNKMGVPDGAEFMKVDLTDYASCQKVVEGMDTVFHLAGIKGSPKIIREQPATFYESMILFNTNMLKAARKRGVERYLYTSSVGVYSPFRPDGSTAEVFYEDDVWKTFPSEHDKAPGWAKRMGELQCEAAKTENPDMKFLIVRPANVYGPYDNFNPINSMVIPSLIRRAVEGERPLTVWGDGSPIRDFIHAQDVSRGMLHVMEIGYEEPLNLGSGIGHTIREVAEIVARRVDPNLPITWDATKPNGDKRRLMDMTRANSIGFYPTVTLEDGIGGTVDWYKMNKDNLNGQYNVFEVK